MDEELSEVESKRESGGDSSLEDEIDTIGATTCRKRGREYRKKEESKRVRRNWKKEKLEAQRERGKGKAKEKKRSGETRKKYNMSSCNFFFILLASVSIFPSCPRKVFSQ